MSRKQLSRRFGEPMEDAHDWELVFRLTELAREAAKQVDDPLLRYDLEAACDALEEDS